MAFIYGLLDPRTQEARYVGQTTVTIQRRLAVHLCLARKPVQGKEPHSCRWIRSLLVLGLVPEIICLEETADPDAAETRWIATYRAAGARLTNITAGGGGRWLAPRAPLSDEHKAKIAAAIKGRKHSEAAKARMRKPKPAGFGEKIAASNIAKKRANQRQAKAIAPRLGRQLSAEHKSKIAAARRGKALSPEHKAKIGTGVAVALRGRSQSPEHVKNVQDALRARRQHLP